MQLKERVDAVAPVREVAHLTNGDVVVALVANRLTAPRPLYDIVEWAEDWAVEETFGIKSAALNDDRLGRCLDDIAAVHDRLRGDLTVQAIAAFGLETTTVRWDLTSVLVPASTRLRSKWRRTPRSGTATAVAVRSRCAISR